MNFLRQNLSLLFFNFRIITIQTNRISLAMKVTLTNASVYCIASKRTSLLWRVTSTGPPDMFFRQKYLPAMDKYIMVHNATFYAGETPDEKLKINELGLYIL